MTVYKNDDVLFGKIEYRKQMVPYGEFFLKDAIDVVPDDEVKIIGNYTSASTTRTMVTGSDGAPSVGTDNFISAGSTFQTDNIAIGDMLIIKDGDDIGSYIVLTIDSETQLSVETHAEGAVSFTGDTANTFEVGKIIFKGMIDKTDFEANQTIEIISRAEELEQIRPSGTYASYSEVIWGEMLKDSSLSDVTVNYTESTVTLRPDADISNDNWDDPNGNDNDVMFDDINESGAADGSYIEVDAGLHNWVEFGLSDPGLSATYNYLIYRVDIDITIKSETNGQCAFQFYNGTSWEDEVDLNTTQNWQTINTSLTSLKYTTADADSFKIKIRDDIGAIRAYYVDKIAVTLYYRYYDDFDDAGLYQHIIVSQGENSLKDYGNLLALIEQQIWYLDADLVIHFNDADKDSGVNFAKTDSIKNIIGTQNIKTYTRVMIKGGYPEGVTQIDSTAGAGFPVWIDTYSDITDQTQLDNLAATLLTEQSANQYIIKMMRYDPTDGLYQVGETVTLPDTPNDISFSMSDRKIPTGQYILNKIDYFLNNGAYFGLDIEIIDGLIFSNPNKDETTGSNAENLSKEGITQVSQIEAGGGGGLQNIVDDTSPQLGGDLDLNSKKIDFPSTANVSDCVSTVENSDTKLVTAGAVFDGLALKLVDPILLTERAEQDAPVANKMVIWAEDENGHTVLKYKEADGHTITIGQDMYIIGKNTSGGEIAKGKVVYFNGTSTGKHPNFSLAKADALVTMPAIGITMSVVANNGFTTLMIKGRLTGLNTPWANGTVLYVSSTVAGGYVNTFPPSPSIDQQIGIVEVNHATTGVLLVDFRQMQGRNDGTIRQSFNIGDGASGDVTLAFNGDAGNDGSVVWDVSEDQFVFDYDINVPNIVTAGSVDGVDVSGIPATVAAKLPLAGGEMSGNITMAGAETVDGKDVSGLCTEAEAHAYVEANALTLTQDVTFNTGQTFDGEDVSALATDLGRRRGGIEPGMFWATYNFKDEADATAGTDIAFVDSVTTAAKCVIIASHNSHRKVLQITANNLNLNYIVNLFAATHTSGSIEFFFETSAVTNYIYIHLHSGATYAIEIRMNGANLQYRDQVPAWNTIKVIEPNTKYHMRLDFDCGTDTFDCYIDGEKLITGGDFTNVVANVDSFTIGCYNDDKITYWDAIGYSWDTDYNIGDNYVPLINSDGIDMLTKKIINAADPADDQDYSTKKYVDDSTIATLTLQQVTDHGAVTTTATEFQDALTVITPTTDFHASTKKYVDDSQDNLGNHTATQTLDMDGNKIDNVVHIQGDGIIYIAPSNDEDDELVIKSEGGTVKIHQEGASDGSEAGAFGFGSDAVAPFVSVYAREIFDDDGILGEYSAVDDFQLLREIQTYEREKALCPDFPNTKQKVFDMNTLPWVRAHPDVDAIPNDNNKKRYSLPIGARDGYFLSTMKKMLEEIDRLKIRIKELEEKI